MNLYIFAAFEMSYIPVEMFAFFIGLYQFEKFNFIAYAFNYNNVKQTVIRNGFGSGFVTAAVITCVAYEAKESVKGDGLAVIYCNCKPVFGLCCRRVNTADTVGALSRNEREFFDFALHGANFGVHTH